MPVDPRFFTPLGALALREIADLTGAELVGGGAELCDGIGASNAAMAGEICFHEGDATGASRVSSYALACFVRPQLAEHLPSGVAALVTDRPRYAHAIASRALFRPRAWTGGDAVSQTACVHETASLAPGAVVGDGAAIGEYAEIGPNAVIGPGVQVGRRTRVGPNASVMCALVGNDVSIGSGSRIGEPGFGTIAGPDGAEEAPQFGRVIIQDHCRIGANTCIDRGAFGDTVLGERTKIDNLCQIAHNVMTGQSVVIAAFSGISGSVKIGDGALLGGQVGIADHVTIGKGVSLAGSAGVIRDVPDGETWGGTPAQPIRQWMREVAWLQKQVRDRKKPSE